MYARSGARLRPRFRKSCLQGRSSGVKRRGKRLSTHMVQGLRQIFLNHTDGDLELRSNLGVGQSRELVQQKRLAALRGQSLDAADDVFDPAGIVGTQIERTRGAYNIELLALQHDRGLQCGLERGALAAFAPDRIDG